MDPLQFLMNAHSWYTLDTPSDHVRAWLWCVSNFLTFASYFLIPFEIKLWSTCLPFRSTKTISRLFITFIVACGLSHLVMIVIMPTAPWWAILTVYLPMAGVSLATVLVLRRHRSQIVQVLQSMARLLDTK